MQLFFSALKWIDSAAAFSISYRLSDFKRREEIKPRSALKWIDSAAGFFQIAYRLIGYGRREEGKMRKASEKMI